MVGLFVMFFIWFIKLRILILGENNYISVVDLEYKYIFLKFWIGIGISYLIGIKSF